MVTVSAAKDSPTFDWFLFLSKPFVIWIINDFSLYQNPFVHWIINEAALASNLIQSVSIYSANSQNQPHWCNIQNHIWPWKCSEKVLIWSGLTRKFHQRFMKRIISTCTFKPPPTQLENCWHTSICEEFRLAILLEYIQTPLWTAPPVQCTHNLLFTFDVCPNVCFVNLYCCLYLHYFWNYNLVLE